MFELKLSGIQTVLLFLFVLYDIKSFKYKNRIFTDPVYCVFQVLYRLRRVKKKYLILAMFRVYISSPGVNRSNNSYQTTNFCI